MATLRANRNTVIRKVVEKYIDKDYDEVEQFVSEFQRRLEHTYDDEHLLTEKVEEFLAEVGVTLKSGIKSDITRRRTLEKESCGLLDDNKDNVDTFESQDKEFEKRLDEIFNAVGDYLNKLRTQVEFTDKDQSEIARRTRILLEDCKNGIGDGYKINSKKMVDELEKAVKEYVANKVAPSNPGGEDR